MECAWELYSILKSAYYLKNSFYLDFNSEALSSLSLSLNYRIRIRKCSIADCHFSFYVTLHISVTFPAEIKSLALQHCHYWWFSRKMDLILNLYRHLSPYRSRFRSMWTDKSSLKDRTGTCSFLDCLDQRYVWTEKWLCLEAAVSRAVDDTGLSYQFPRGTCNMAMCNVSDLTL